VYKFMDLFSYPNLFLNFSLEVDEIATTIYYSPISSFSHLVSAWMSLICAIVSPINWEIQFTLD
jgi:hypothetical protein